ncbi:conserved hypothetical protein [uncultured Desulfobacterium sp.]|uniref:AMP nucleosidase n=1 Tax=uncultured Desulfobacterium sp. TaxID=201089 RepID=A0A445MVQ7_9BACT|nr:conserved hypothetical protein [uncultured Desulfobacterium sp.]
MELHFTKTNGPVDEAIERLFDIAGDVHHRDIVRDIILAALKAGQENSGRMDLKIMNTTLKEMRFTAKVFNTYRGIRKVAAFGSARTRPDEPIYHMARDLGRRLADAGFMVITGGGSGIMQAVNEGAGPDRSFGVNIRLPFDQTQNPIVRGNHKSITYKYFFNRKIAFLKESDAVVLFPGGFGTLDEAMESLTLVQTGKRAPLPLVLLDAPDGTYWTHWVNFIKEGLMDRGFITSNDPGLFEVVDSADAAVEKIKHFYSNYHSLRYVAEKLVLRLNRKISQNEADELKARFDDILIYGGEIRPSGPLEQEEDEPNLSHLPRVVVDFNKKDFARLHKLIDAINGLG